MLLSVLLWSCFLRVVVKVNQPCRHFKTIWKLVKKYYHLENILVALGIIFNDSGFFQTHYKAKYVLYCLLFT